METIKEIVCRNCKRILDKTQNLSEIARLMQINPTTISRWKSGKHAPELDKLDKLAEIIGIDPMEFFSTEEKSKPDSLELIKQIASLGPIEVQVLQNTIKALTKPINSKKDLRKEG